MKDINYLLRKLSISKVNLAKFLGVSRQMLYNYLALDDLNDWPEDKKEKMGNLFDIKSYNEIKDIVINDEYKERIIEVINSNIDLKKSINVLQGFENKETEEEELLYNITKLMKKNLDSNKKYLNTYNYLYNFLKYIDKEEKLSYIMAYYSKMNLDVDPLVFDYNREEQMKFEAVLFTALNLYDSGNASETKLVESHDKFIQAINNKRCDFLTHTQELAQIRDEAMKELGIDSITPETGKAVLDMIEKLDRKKRRRS